MSFEKIIKKMKLMGRIAAPKSKGNFSTNLSKNDFLSIANMRYPVLDADFRFAFFSHNKVAQTSINRKLLCNRAIVRKDSKTVWNYALNRQEALWNQRQPFVFTIVRNPYARTMSAFYYLQKIGKISNEIDFEKFILSVLANMGTAFDPHFQPQEMFPQPILEIGFDAVIRIEDLGQRWPDVADIIRTSRKLPTEKSTSKSKDARSISPKARRVIEELYQNDFERLGYKKISQ